MFALAFVAELASRPSPPVAAAKAFLSALTYNECGAMLAHLSRESRSRVERAGQADQPGLPTGASLCQAPELARYHGLSSFGPRVIQRTAGEALVSVERRTPTEFLFPGFWGTKHDVTIEHIRLVREHDAWKISLDE
jgi:hypothetical protein